jgi:cytochrome c oxidase cbb3-type subunit 4
MSQGLAQGFITLLTFAVFIGICVWAYRPGNRARFDDDARLPFDDDPIDERTLQQGEMEGGR